MRLSVALLVCAALIAACGEDDDETAAPSGSLADLAVEVDPDGPDPEKAKTATVQNGGGIARREDAAPLLEAAQ